MTWNIKDEKYLIKNYGKIKVKGMFFPIKQHSFSSILSKSKRLKLKSNRSFLISGNKNPFYKKHHNSLTKKVLSKKNKLRFKDLKNRFFGEKNGMFGKKMTLLAKKKIKEWWRSPKNKKIIKKLKIRNSKRMKNKNFNPVYKDEVIRKLSNKLSGKNNPMYKHGEGRFPYPMNWNNNKKEQIRKRDNCCMICKIPRRVHIKYYKRDLSIHHIDGIKENCTPENLICLCLYHHGKIQNIQDDLKDYFHSKIIDFY